MTDAVQVFHQMRKFPSEVQFFGNFFHTPKQYLKVTPVCADRDMVSYKIRTLAHHMIGTHHQAEKSGSFRSNIVDLIVLTRYISNNKIFIFHQLISSWAIYKNNKSCHDFVKETMFPDAKHFCNMCIHCCTVLVQNRPS